MLVGQILICSPPLKSTFWREENFRAKNFEQADDVDPVEDEDNDDEEETTLTQTTTKRTRVLTQRTVQRRRRRSSWTEGTRLSE